MREAINLGVKVVGDAEVSELILDEKSKRVKGVKTSKGKQFFLKDYSKGNVILCCGSWSKETVSKLTSKSIISKELYEKINKVSTPSAQCVLTLQMPENLRHKFKDVPVVLNFRTGFYQFEPNSEGIMKIAIHGEGYQNPLPPLGISEIKPPHFPSQSSSTSSSSSTPSNHSIPSSKVSEMLAELHQIYPSLKSVPILESRICWYSDSKDENWIIDHHPDVRNLVVCTGDSGHGFKFLPVLGRLIAARIGLESFKPLTEHQKKVFSFDHHFKMIGKQEVEMADSGRAKNQGNNGDEGNLRARL